VREALEASQAVVICPSNPWVSIDPILKILALTPTPLHEGEGRKIDKPVVAVSPIIGGKTVKGPAAKMYAELGIEPSALAVAEHYRNLLTGFVLDSQDKQLSDKFKECKILVTDTLMNSTADRARLAMDVLQFVGSL
jgi:LPPG:FO 2-phospho-L-lactate transferase